MPTTPETIKASCDRLSLTLAVAESASGGHLAALLTSVSGASSYFRGGVVAYHIDVKVDVLGVDGQHASKVNCVSEQVAKEMASGVRRLLGTSVGIAITGYAEPDSDGETYAWVGFDVRGQSWAERVPGVDAPWLNRQERRIANQDDYAQTAAEGLIAFLEDHGTVRTGAISG